MLNLNRLIEDRYSYPLCPQEHRWIYNKLTIAETMGYNCAPSGTPIKKPGFYCMRPVMACSGNGEGGFLKFHAKNTQAGIEQPPYRSGYFWCEWFKGWHGWTDFTDDEPVYECGGIPHNDRIVLRYDTDIHIELPDSLRGISKHMMVEHIGGNIIEVSPRHMVLHIGDGHGRKTMYQKADLTEFGVMWKFDPPSKRYEG